MLRTHMRSVELGPLTILLDLKRNKYLTLPTKSLAQALETQAPQNALWMKLQAAQMIEPPSASEIKAAHARFWPALRWSTVQVARGRLDVTFAELARCKLKRGGAAARIAPALAFYRTWRPWYPARIICLFDSLALIKFLLAIGAPANIQLVLGVRGMPFEAHCWLEHDGAVVNDEVDNCASFAEIARV